MLEFERVPERDMFLKWSVDFLPGQTFGMCFPENFTARNTEAFVGFWDTQIEWHFSDNLAEGSAASEQAELLLRVFQEPDERTVAWHMSFKNISDGALDGLAAFNCLQLCGAPLFQDLSMARTKVRDAAGNWCELSRIPKTTGRRTIQFYPATGGIELDEHPWVRRFELTSKQTLSGNSIQVESVDGTWTLENAVHSPIAFFFNNWEPHAGCIHVAPLFGSVLPGQESTARGTIRFTKHE